MACEESPLWVHWEVSLVETVNILGVCVCLSQSEREAQLWDCVQACREASGQH